MEFRQPAPQVPLHGARKRLEPRLTPESLYVALDTQLPATLEQLPATLEELPAALEELPAALELLVPAIATLVATIPEACFGARQR